MSRPPPISLAGDLADRWRRARDAALETATVDPGADQEADAPVQLPSQDRALFVHSRRLGQSFRRYVGAELTLADAMELLPRLGSPCAAGGYARREDLAAAAARSPCKEVGSACGYWREATHGLLSGMTDALRYSRVRSGNTDGACTEVLHVLAESPERLAPLPAHLHEALEKVAHRMERVVAGAVDGGVPR
jgi:hypothetical protein